MANYEKLIQNLTRFGFIVSEFETAADAAVYLNRSIDHTTIGFGGSQTVRDMGLFEELAEHNDCYWHWNKELGIIPEEAEHAETYICSVNAVSEDGALLNIDGRGNRVVSTIQGHKRLFLIIGENKIAPDFESALWRARNIAAPLNAKRLEKKTPCAVTGKCMNCSSPDRICTELVVLWQKPQLIDRVEVILIHQDLGF